MAVYTLHTENQNFKTKNVPYVHRVS